MCFVAVPKPYIDKFKSRTIPAVFIGYGVGKKAYKLLNLSTYAIFHSRDVVFHEHIFPYSDSSSSHLFPPPVPSSSIPTSPSPPPPSSPSSSSAPPTYDFSPSFSSFQSPSSISSGRIFYPPLRRSSRPTQTPIYLKDYICTSISSSQTLLSSSSENCLLEPQFYHQVVRNPAWQEAMIKEFQALKANNTWSIVPLPSGKKDIP